MLIYSLIRKNYLWQLLCKSHVAFCMFHDTFTMKCPVSGAKGMFSFILNRFFNVLFCWLLHRSSLEIKCPRSGAKKVNALLCLKIIPPTFYPTLNLTNSVKKANLRGKCICWSNHDILTAFTSLWATLWSIVTCVSCHLYPSAIHHNGKVPGVLLSKFTPEKLYTCTETH